MSDSENNQVSNTPRSSSGSNNILSYSSSSISPSASSSSSSGKSAVSECLNSWLTFLQNLQNLSSSGHRLAQSIVNLESFGTSDFLSQGAAAQPPTSQLGLEIMDAWKNLAAATNVATNTVKSHIISVLQDFITQATDNETEIQRSQVREHNHGIFSENAQTMINLQHQFCVASLDLFAPLMVCGSCKTAVGQNHDNDCALIQQQQHLMKGPDRSSQPHFDRGSSSTHSSDHQSTFECRTSPNSYLDNLRGPLPNPGHLLGMKMPYRGSRSPLNFPLFPNLNGQARRWSEAAAAEQCSESILDPESQCRRWSMPDKTVHWSQTRIMPISKLAVPGPKMGSDRSTPDSTWQSSSNQDGLAEAIQLLSCRPLRIPQNISHPPAFIEEQTQQEPTEPQYGMWRQGQANNPPFPMNYGHPPYDGKF